ncbi:MAG: macro domain-containing protein [Endomicrobiia bacterium]
MKKEVLLKNTTIKIIFGDITQIPVDAIVTFSNTELKMYSRLAKVIKQKCGDIIQKECAKLAPIDIGASVITSSFKLKTCKYIIHSATMDIDFKTNQEYIRLATRNVLKSAEKKSIKSVSFPLLSSNTEKFPYEYTAKIMAEEVAKYILENKETKIREIIFVLEDKKAYKIFSELIPAHIGYINRKIGVYPIPTVDIIINVKTKNKSGIVLIERKNPPYGWAIPGGFVEYNESLETTAVREAKEETGLKIKNLRQFHTYSEPGRDPRFHTISTVFIAEADKLPKASSDAKKVVVATKKEILSDKYQLVFDHKKILQDYFSKTGTEEIF